MMIPKRRLLTLIFACLRLNKTDKKNSFLFTVKVAPSLIQAHLAVTKFSSFVFNTMAEKLCKKKAKKTTDIIR